MRLDLCKGGHTIPTSSSLSCSRVIGWMMSCMFLIILERKVQINCIFWGFICGGFVFYDDLF